MKTDEFNNLKVGDRVAFSGEDGCVGSDYTDETAVVSQVLTHVDDRHDLVVCVRFGDEELNVSFCCINLLQTARDPDDCLKAINRWRDKHLQRSLETAGWSADDLRIEAIRLGV